MAAFVLRLFNAWCFVTLDVSVQLHTSVQVNRLDFMRDMLFFL